jgi:hypothetical protein
VVKRVYLDQNKWIDLAAAVRGLKKGERYQDALLVIEAGVEVGDLSLPLSSAHYMETNVRRDWRSRRDLAMTMAALSQMHTIAPIQAVIPPEIDRALQTGAARPGSPRELKPFGFGAGHAFAEDIPPYRLPEHIVWQVADRWGLEGDINRVREIMLLAGPTPTEEAEMPDFKPLAHLAVAEQYARDKEALRDRRRAAGWEKGERAERIAHAQAFADHIDVINEALELAQLSSDVVTGDGRAGMSRFLRSVPTLWASSELERLRHSGSQREWERQDLLDITALAVASVYCDVVVTERVWVDAAQRAGLDAKLQTTFLRRVDDLPAHLV